MWCFYVAIFLTILALVSIIFHIWAIFVTRRRKNLKNVKRVLIITAHPDDECMFFAPTVLGLLQAGCDLHLLCLSSGNYQSHFQGLQRKVELRHSCQRLGIPIGNIVVIEHSKLSDDPGVAWNKTIIKEVLLKYIEKLSLDTIITFDDYGVSGHLNHISIYRAMQTMYSKGHLPVGTQVFCLKSVNLLRKYVGIVDCMLSYCSATYVYVSGYRGIIKAQMAMCQHRSQLTWYRWLYIVFSRYMIMNTLQRIAVADVVVRNKKVMEMSKEC